ncbi:dihydrolipoyl dehydrogenase [Scenedesmus sp. NREL 46B-D3]|nr:dihydrolipoyl dehydrogenase [Scenedesmus sp. NREL 46B-D3]
MALRRAARQSVLLSPQFRQLAFATGARGYAAGEQQDVVVIGGGPGGYVAAIKGAQLGLKVTCVEGRGSLGGTCLNVGCIPSKALLNSSHMYYEADKHFKAYGVTVGSLGYDWAQMQKQKDDAVSGLTKGIEGLFKKNKVEYVKGWGTIKGRTSTTVSGKNILIATGSEVTPLKGVPVDEERIVSSTGALSLYGVPKTMVVIGGGYIGLEMGSVYQRLGAQVTVVEFADNIVPTMDGEMRKAFQRSLTKQGMKFKLGTKVNSAARKGDTVVLEVEPAKGGDKSTMEVDVVLVSAGRRPYVTGLGLENVGITPNRRGQIEVDSHFRTSVPSIYAIGDCIPGPMLAHKAEEDGVAAVEIMAGKAGHVNYNTVPSIVYTHPEVASVGLSEEEAKAQNLDYKTGKFAFVANSRARPCRTPRAWLVKFISDKKTDKILGAWIMGPNAGELIPECVLAMEYGACTEDIARACHGHPTLSEAIKEAAMATVDKPIHS